MFTGEDARNVSRSGDVFPGFDIISGPLLGVFLFHQGEEKAVILVDEFLRVLLSYSIFSLSTLTLQLYRPMCIPIPTPTPNIQKRTAITLLTRYVPCRMADTTPSFISEMILRWTKTRACGIELPNWRAW
jgi:hypothetical protein